LIKNIFYIAFALCISFTIAACNYATHRTLTGNQVTEDEDPEPDYRTTLSEDYQDYVSYIFMGNRNDNFSTYFNKYFTSLEEYDEGMKEYKTLIIANYNRRLDSIYTLPILSVNVKDKLNGVIAKCSKIIQYNKNSRFLDASVLLIGKSYYYLQDFYQSERKFNEFFSKLNISNLSDEAILYQGKTKLRLKKIDEGLLILNNLIDKSKDPDIKSEATQELALYYISQKNYKDGIDNIKKSIELTNNKENKAEKQFLLARLYTSIDPLKAKDEYLSVYDNTSDFDLIFYSRLNYAKVLNLSGKPKEAYALLDVLNYKYREYTDLRQLSDVELANSLNLQGSFSEAMKKYFSIIVTYPNSKASSEAYYKLAKHYEDTEHNYLKAFVCYKKVNEQNPYNDYSDFCALRVNTFNKYFTLIATINDTTKGEIPAEDVELEKYRKIIDIEKGIDKEKIKGNEKEKEKLKDPKGGGIKNNYSPMDSIVEKGREEKKKGEEPLDSLKEQTIDTNTIINKGNDSLGLILEKNKQDSLLLIQKSKEDSILIVGIKSKEQNKFNAFLELSEIFIYELSKPDSAEFYISKAINFSQNPENQAKAYYFLATLYKNFNRQEEANQIFNKIIEISPGSVFANESRKNLGVTTIDIGKDEPEKLYNEAETSITTNLYREALKPLEYIISNYNTSTYYPRALYFTGWIFEYIIGNKDSMIYYYKKLNTEFPQSEYVQNITGKIGFYSVSDTTKTIDTLRTFNDSTKTGIDTTKLLLDSLNENMKLLDNPIDTTKLQDEQNPIKEEENIKEQPKKK
jgi:tetratricopeptide (TPR) repeat protein